VVSYSVVGVAPMHRFAVTELARNEGRQQRQLSGPWPCEDKDQSHQCNPGAEYTRSNDASLLTVYPDSRRSRQLLSSSPTCYPRLIFQEPWNATCTSIVQLPYHCVKKNKQSLSTTKPGSWECVWPEVACSVLEGECGYVPSYTTYQRPSSMNPGKVITLTDPRKGELVHWICKCTLANCTWSR
jgi:hypothetical protein